MDILFSSITQGILWSIMAIGVYITFRILDIADLTVEGSFPLGGAVTVHFITQGINPFVATILGMIAGMIAGLVSGILHTEMNIPPLLSGIITLTGLYSINLVILGKANVSLLDETTLVTKLKNLGFSKEVSVFILGAITIILVLAILGYFFNTQLGLSLRSTGDNIYMSEANGIDVRNMKILGYMISNGLVALSGSLLAQNNGFGDLNMGIGTIVIGLASIITAEVIMKNLSITKRLITIVIGAIVYRFIIVFVLAINVNPQMIKLVSALILATILFIPDFQKSLGVRSMKKVFKEK